MKKLFYYINTTFQTSRKKLPKFTKKNFFFRQKIPIFKIVNIGKIPTLPQALKKILRRYKNHRNNHLVNTTPRGKINGFIKSARSMIPTRKKTAIPLKSTNLCRKYIVIGFIPITIKKKAHFLYPLTSIIQNISKPRRASTEANRRPSKFCRSLSKILNLF